MGSVDEVQVADGFVVGPADASAEKAEARKLLTAIVCHVGNCTEAT